MPHSGSRAARPRWLVTGAAGMLATDLVAALRDAGQPVTAARRVDLDVTDRAAVQRAVDGHDIVVNTAAYTDVDQAESDVARATAVNATAVAHLAGACAAVGAVLVQISTDYVLAGDAAAPYPEDSRAEPVNVYGRTKLLGEQAALAAGGYVVRTAWLYGAHGDNFVRTVLRLAESQEYVAVVDDERGQPTWTCALSEQLISLGTNALAGRAVPGVYHGTAAGEVTRYELARTVFGLAGWDVARVRRADRDQFRRPARRPRYTVLGHDGWARAELQPMAHWRDALAAAFRHAAVGGTRPIA